MANIEPIKIWKSGEKIEATQFKLTIVKDNLKDTCAFQYTMLAEDGAELDSGGLTMDGEDYSQWSGESEYAYQWAANKLNITICK
jgi:hypothetical protein